MQIKNKQFITFIKLSDTVNNVYMQYTAVEFNNCAQYYKKKNQI